MTDIDELTSEFQNIDFLSPDSKDTQIPSGHGLTKSEARKLLVEEMDHIVIKKNQERLRLYREHVKSWQNGQGKRPKEPIFVKGYGMKNLNKAVFKARQIGGYGSLLKAAGY